MMGSVMTERERGLMERKGLPQMQESEACSPDLWCSRSAGAGHGSSKVADKPGTACRDRVMEVSDFRA